MCVCVTIYGNPFDRKMQSLMAIILYCVLHLGVVSASLTHLLKTHKQRNLQMLVLLKELYTLVIAIGIVVKILYHMENWQSHSS